MDIDKKVNLYKIIKNTLFTFVLILFVILFYCNFGIIRKYILK